jgi:hypothetical protein
LDSDRDIRFAISTSVPLANCGLMRAWREMAIIQRPPFQNLMVSEDADM